MFKKKIKSNNCIIIKHKVLLNEKEIVQTQYLTENYVYTEATGKKIIYIPKKDKQYTVDTDKKRLKELDLSTPIMQINQIKSIIGKVKISGKAENGIRHILIQNNAESTAKLDVDLQITTHQGLESTAYKQFNKFQQSIQLFNINLNENEIIKTTDSVFTFNGQEQKSNLELIEIKSNTESIDMFDEYFNYKIEK